MFKFILHATQIKIREIFALKTGKAKVVFLKVQETKFGVFIFQGYNTNMIVKSEPLKWCFCFGPSSSLPPDQFRRGDDLKNLVYLSLFKDVIWMQRTSEIFHDDFYDFHADLKGNNDNIDEKRDAMKVFWCNPPTNCISSKL